MDLIHGPHYVYHCDYHIVMVTKYRKALFDEGIFAFFKLKLAEITDYYPMIHFKTINHDRDHLHFLVSIPPTTSVGKVIGLIKQNTSRELKQKFPFIRAACRGNEEVWSSGYFVSTVGITDSIIKRYIENQGKKDSGQLQF